MQIYEFRNINVIEEWKKRKGERRGHILLRNVKEAQDAGMQLGDGAGIAQSFAYTGRARVTIVTWIDKYSWNAIATARQ